LAAEKKRREAAEFHRSKAESAEAEARSELRRASEQE
jgi:hypothetical protein